MDDVASQRRTQLFRVAAELRRAAGHPMAAGIALPAIILMTDAAGTPDPAATAAVLPGGSAVVLRHYEHPQRRSMALALADVCRAHGILLLVGGDAALATDVRAAGVHWPERLLEQELSRPALPLLTVSVHSAAALAQARRVGADAAILGPVFATDSHPTTAPLGVARLRALVEAAELPVLAVGGITAENAAQLLGSGVAGIAAVRALAAPKNDVRSAW